MSGDVRRRWCGVREVTSDISSENVIDDSTCLSEENIDDAACPTLESRMSITCRAELLSPRPGGVCL